MLGRRSYERDLARPVLPRPRCRVKLVCGPPAAGKSTYVVSHAGQHDVIVDFDALAREMGFGRERPSWLITQVLEVRNERLAALSLEPPERVAWVILSAPSKALRAWWRSVLGVALEDVIVLVPTREELRRRIFKDPDRPTLRFKLKQMEVVDSWFRKESMNDPGFGVLRSGCGVDGEPTDPLHPWNKVEEDDEH